MSDLKAFIRDEFDGAWNAHDVNRALGYFADDAVVQTVPPMPGGPDAYQGKQAIRGFVEGLTPGFHVDSSNFEEAGDRISWFSRVSCDAFRQMDVEALECRTEAVVKDRKITSFKPTFTPSAVAMLQAAQHKALMRRCYDEVINGGRLDLADELLADDFVEHEEFPGSAGGREGFKQFFSMFRNAFPDLRFDVEDMIAEGDRVVARIAMTGTHRGDFAGIPATGRRVNVSAIDIVRFDGGKAVEHWANTDTLGMMQQLGVIPEEEAAAHHTGDGGVAPAPPDNTALVRSFYEAYNRRDFDYAARYTAEDATLVNVATGETLRGPEGTRAFLQGWATAFPDSAVEVTRLIASGDQVVVEFIGRGKHTGPLATPAGEVPATGRSVEIHFCDVWQIRDGKVAQNRTYFDLATMMRQLGLLSEAAHT